MSQRSSTDDGNDRHKKIHIRIRGQDGNTVDYNLPRNLKFIKLFQDYCKKKQFDFRTVRFFHEGNRVQGRSTPAKDGNTVIFTISRNLKLSVLFRRYCERKQFDIRTVQFLHEGRRLRGKYTAAKLNLEDEAEICCMYHQTGGGFYVM